MGDTPYTEGEVRRLDTLIEDLNKEEVAFVVHVGDIGSGGTACNDAWLQARKLQFARIKHKLIVIPGDNEWVDCKDPQGASRRGASSSARCRSTWSASRANSASTSAGWRAGSCSSR